MNPTLRRRPSGFTLIELLVVVAIVALLIGILLPSLGAARRSGRGAACASNLRQLVTAANVYATDARERFMPGAAEFRTRNLRRWHGARTSPGDPFSPQGGPITPYLEGGDAGLTVRGCPEFAPTLDELSRSGSGFERGCGGYGYNNAFAGVDRERTRSGAWRIRSDLTGSPRSRFSRPSATLLFADAALAQDRVIEYSFVEPRWWAETPPPLPDGGASTAGGGPSRPDPSTHFRHAGRANVGWMDGHVSGEAMAETAFSGVFPLDPGPVQIGWPGLGPGLRGWGYD
ncbi:MAG: prepilin-type N-terminal cleavage/methylation domain-containing protein [Phycisphaerales bacterium]|nr:prepilin-type N-terminal cleavage/methylation domain-containing protein [Phycisphaerales bacterium]